MEAFDWLKNVGTVPSCLIVDKHAGHCSEVLLHHTLSTCKYRHKIKQQINITTTGGHVHIMRLTTYDYKRMVRMTFRHNFIMS